MHITHQSESKCGLEQVTWVFGVILTPENINVYIESYTVRERPSKRHAWKHVVRRYDRLNQRDSSIKDIKDVPFPDEGTALIAQRVKDLVWVTKEYPR